MRRRWRRGGAAWSGAARSRPWRAALPVSARDGERAAVRSAGAVDRSPYRCSAARQASRTRYRSFTIRGRVRSWRASIATRWMWSGPCRIAIHRTASSSCPRGHSPVRCITSRAMSGPLPVRQQAVLGGGAHRAVPDRLGVPPLAERVVREPQQPGQSAEVPAAIGAQRGFQVSGRAVAGDDVRVGVFLPASGAVQVADQPGHVLAARADFPDHRSPAPGHRSRPAERHPLGSGPRGTPSALGADRRGTPSGSSVDHRMAARNMVRLPVRVARVRGWPAGTWSAGLPRLLPAGPRGGGSLPRTGEGHQTTARSRSASRPPGSSSRRSAAPAARHGPGRRRRPAAARPAS